MKITKGKRTITIEVEDSDIPPSGDEEMYVDALYLGALAGLAMDLEHLEAGLSLTNRQKIQDAQAEMRERWEL